MCPARAIVVALALAIAGVTGCTSVAPSGNLPLAATTVDAESVGLEIFFVRVPLGDPLAGPDLWSEIDEQQFPVEMRRRLSANGFRVGVVGTTPPAALQSLLKLEEKPAATTPGMTVVDLENEPTVRQRLLRIRGGRRTNIVCTGEQTQHAELCVLLRGDDGQVHGRTYKKAKGMFAARAFPQGDGRVKLDLLPELEHGDPARRYDPGEGMLRLEFGPPHEKFESLRIETCLAPGQILVLSCLPERPGSLGYHYFTDKASERLEQKLLLVRVAQAQFDDLFNADEPPGEEH